MKSNHAIDVFLFVRALVSNLPAVLRAEPKAPWARAKLSALQVGSFTDWRFAFLRDRLVVTDPAVTSPVS